MGRKRVGRGRGKNGGGKKKGGLMGRVKKRKQLDTPVLETDLRLCVCICVCMYL